jgi:hypothetical protein
MARQPVYQVLVRAFANSSFLPGVVLADFQDMKNLGWGEYLNDLGDCFFTVNQDDPKIANLIPYLKGNAIVQVYRNSTLVWSGWLMESDEDQEDVVFTAYSYLAGLYWLLSDYAQEWTAANISTIISDLWTRARATLTHSGLAWTSTGTIEVPVTTSGGATPMTQGYYKTYRKRILFVMKELAAMATSDTTNVVSFEITPAGVFNLYKARGTDLTVPVWEYPSKKVIGFRRVRNMADRRNTLYGVGSNPRNAVLQKTVEDATDQTNNMRREEGLFYTWVRDEDELQRITEYRLSRAERDDSMLTLTFAPNGETPYRGAGAVFALGDRVPILIQRGITQINERKLITGQQVVLTRGSEYLRLYLQDVL